MRKLLAILICLSLTIPAAGCASAGQTPVTVAPQPSVDAGAMAGYVQRLPAGSRVRIERADGSVMHGTLMSATEDRIVVQKNTRLPEPPIEVPVAQLARVTTENSGTSTAKAVAIGIASGVGAFFAILAIAFAANGD